MDGTRSLFNWNKPHWERQITHSLSHAKCRPKFYTWWIVLRWEPAGRRRVKGEREVEWIWPKYFIHMSENRIMKPFEIVFKKGWERVCRRWIWLMYIICIWINTVKPLCIINIH
jgi:hypothetical protein